MNERIVKYLYDIKIALDEIYSFFANKPKKIEEYISDILLKRAIERNLEIIGEAMNRILNISSKNNILSYSKFRPLPKSLSQGEGLG